VPGVTVISWALTINQGYINVATKEKKNNRLRIAILNFNMETMDGQINVILLLLFSEIDTM
jgi:hypothetical protein